MKDIVRGQYFLSTTLDKGGGQNELIYSKILLQPNQKGVLEYTNPVIYEVLRIENMAPLFLREHTQRLKNSLSEKGYSFTIEESVVKDIIKQIVIGNEISEGNIKIAIDPVKGVFNAYFIPHYYPTKEQYIQGVDLITLKLEREDPNIKIQTEQYKTRVNDILADKAFFEALLIDQEGNVTEGSKSNFFLIKDNIIYTSPDETVLKGITREKVLFVCKELHVDVKKEFIKFKNLKAFESAFITGTSPKVLPVKSVNCEINFNVRNPLLKKILEQYNQLLR